MCIRDRYLLFRCKISGIPCFKTYCRCQITPGTVANDRDPVRISWKDQMSRIKCFCRCITVFQRNREPIFRCQTVLHRHNDMACRPVSYTHLDVYKRQPLELTVATFLLEVAYVTFCLLVTGVISVLSFRVCLSLNVTLEAIFLPLTLLFTFKLWVATSVLDVYKRQQKLYACIYIIRSGTRHEIF